jgi:hypothetical protein
VLCAWVVWDLFGRQECSGADIELDLRFLFGALIIFYLIVVGLL